MVLMNVGSVRHDARVRKEAAALGRVGHQVTLVARRQPGETFGRHLDGLELSLFQLYTLRLPRCSFTLALRYVEFSLRSALRVIAGRSDVVHAHDLTGLLPAWIGTRITGAKVIYDAHELFTERPIEVPWLWRRVERYLIRRVDRVIAANEDRAEVMRSEYGAREMPTVVMNSPDHVSSSTGNGPSLRERLPAAARGKRVVLYQGGLSPNRCLENLVLAAEHFDDRSVLVLVGSPTDFSQQVLAPLVRNSRLEAKVFFADPVDSTQLVSYIRSADLGVVIYKNSCRNNFLCAPNKLFEYSMAGIPSIGCDFPPIRRIGVTAGVTRVFDPEDPLSIASVAMDFLSDEPGYLRAKAAASKLALDFTWTREAEKLVNLYNGLCAETTH